jgi:hypothetical protein
MNAAQLCNLYSESTRFEIQITEGNTDWGRQFFPPSLQANYGKVFEMGNDSLFSYPQPQDY